MSHAPSNRCYYAIEECFREGLALLALERACHEVGVMVAPYMSVYDELGLCTTRKFAMHDVILSGLSAAGRWIPAEETPAHDARNSWGNSTRAPTQ